MLTERHSYRIPNDGEESGVMEQMLSVDEILEEYEIKGLSLEDLQEKYVNMVDNYEEQKRELEDKYDSLNSSVDNLKEEIYELKAELNEPSEVIDQTENNISLSYLSFFVIIVITGIIAFCFGKNFNKKR